MNKEEKVKIEGMEGARRATGIPSIEKSQKEGNLKTVPNPEVSEKTRRRRYTAAYKVRILELADQCTEPGRLGALLRREGLYYSNLNAWRHQRSQGVLNGLQPKKRGRKELKRDPNEKEIARLRKENERLAKELKKAELIIDVQKKTSELLGITLQSLDEGEKC